MNTHNLKLQKYKRDLKTIVERSVEAKLVKNRYKVLLQLLIAEWPSLTSYSSETLTEITRDIVWLDRQIRKETEGSDTETKFELAKVKMEELEYTI